MPEQAWQKTVFDVLKQADVKQIAYVPDAGHAYLIKAATSDPDIRDIVLTTEEEGVGIALGAWLGGQRAAVFMQSSGVGNCINMFSLLENCRCPFLTVVTMRGEWAELNPWQSPMGRRTQGMLELMGMRVYRADRESDVEDVISAAIDSAYGAGEQVAVILGQRLIGRKDWGRAK
jgi:sulfopyruvate decarboxylase alpha subunit